MLSKNRIKFFKTIGFRIALWYLLSVMGILLFSGTFLYYRLRHTLVKKAYNLMLDEEQELLLTLLDKNSTRNDLVSSIALEFSEDRHYKLSIRVLDVDGNMVLVSDNFSFQNLETSEMAIAKAKEGKVVFERVRVRGRKYPYRLLTKAVYQEDSVRYILQMGLYMKPMYKTIENLEENFMMLVPVLIIFSIAGGWLIARRSLAPIENINKTTRRITSSNLSARISPTHTGDELDELIMSINLMLNRLEDSFKKTVQFTSDVSHELRTPLAALKTGTEVILSKERTTKEYLELLENNLNALERMSRMITDLLELSKSDSGSNISHLKSFNLGDMLKELQNKFRPVSDSKEIRSSVNGIPDVYINGDEILLRRVFANLLDNAIKYTSPGGRVSVSLEDRRNDDVVVRITDTGVGISEDNIGKIFDRFFRVDKSRFRGTGGTGLGLNISKTIAELHQGKIEVKSELGMGSTFEVTLPKNLTIPESLHT
ncbi:MAG: heavy metal sensor histidine kinase [Candidatus Scalindua sp.]